VRIISLALSVLFLLFALVQWNDPDPVIWILMYAAVAASQFMGVIRKPNPYFLLALMMISLTWAIFYVPDLTEWLVNHEITDLAKTMKAEEQYIEGSREFLGLIICFFAVFFQWKLYKRTAS